MIQATKKMIKDPVLLRILESLNEQGKTEKDFVMYLGLDNGAFTHWKYENQKSFMIHINQISDFLGVSSYYLLRGTEEEDGIETMSKAEKNTRKMYRKLNHDKQSIIKKTLSYLVDLTEYENS
ncbi:MAG: hypothetical protein IJQ21_12640 [Lachnospiraceae bacterium]|nr:hypothetical protein [Lachnospiraceae bacterium]